MQANANDKWNRFQDKRYTYFAFISYKRENEKWAKWLKKGLTSGDIRQGDTFAPNYSAL